MAVVRVVPLVLFSLTVAACDGSLEGGSQGADAGGADTASGAGFEGPAPAFANSPGYGAPPQLTFRVLAGRGSGAPVEAKSLLAALRSADAVCLGETHDSFAAHSMQLLILDRLRRTPDAQFAVGMEMFQKPFQEVLARFSRGEIDEGAMRAETEYDARWRFSWDLYRPLVLHAVSNQHPLLALNAARELTQRVRSVGVAGVSAEERAQLPELDFSDSQHRAWFEAQVGGGTHGQLTAEQLYTTQVIWDETMADTSAAWLKAGVGRRIGILAGRGHCIDGGIPKRMQRRGIARVVGLQILDDEVGVIEEAVAADPADYIVGVSLR